MSVKIVCPSCRAPQFAEEEDLGQKVRCDECDASFLARAVRRRLEADEADPDDEPRQRVRPAGAADRPSRRPRDEEDADPDRRPRRSRDEDDADRPRRRRPKRDDSNLTLYLLVGGGVGFVLLIGLGVGLFFLLQPSTKTNSPTPTAGPIAPMVQPPLGGQPVVQPPLGGQPVVQPPLGGQPAGNPPAMAGQRVQLSNAHWKVGGFGGDFEVDYEFLNGQAPLGKFYTLAWRYSDGNLGSADLHVVFNARGSLQIKVIGPGGRNRRGGMEIWMEEGGVRGPFGGGGTKVSNSVNLN
jgi:hypothetical protein